MGIPDENTVFAMVGWSVIHRYSVNYISIEKNSLLSGPVQFKTKLFKGLLYMLFNGNFKFCNFLIVFVFMNFHCIFRFCIYFPCESFEFMDSHTFLKIVSHCLLPIFSLLSSDISHTFILGFLIVFPVSLSLRKKCYVSFWTVAFIF